VSDADDRDGKLGQDLPGDQALSTVADTVPDADSSDERALGALVRAEQVRGLFSKGYLPYIVNVVNASLVLAVLWPSIDHVVALTWLVLFAGVATARIVFQQAYHRRAPAPEAAPRWGNLFAVGSALFGSFWGVASILFFDGDSLDQVFLIFVIGGMCAAATTSAASYPPAFRAFVVMACVPAVIRFAAEGDRIHGGMAAMVFLFALGTSAIARQGARGLIEAVTLRFRNAAMTERLQETQGELRQLNERLELRVTERTAELEHTLAKLDRFYTLLNQTGAAILVADATTLEVLELNDQVNTLVVGATIGSKLPMLGVASTLATEADWRKMLDGARDVVRTVEDVQEDGSRLRAIELTITVRTVAQRDYVLIAIRDISARKSLEAELQQNGMLASVGRLAAGVGHEINNPLTAVLANLQLVEAALSPTDGELRRLVGDARMGAKRIRDVVRDLRTFSRTEADRSTPLSVNSVLESCLSIANNELKHRASIVTELGKPPNVLADRNRLAQVFLNLLVRAAQAIPVGDAQRNEVRVRSTENDGDAVIEISDTGAPIPPELRAHIFEPFIATRGFGSGTGLALSICHDIVRDLGGTIEVHSPSTGGSRFRIRLPRAPEVTTTPMPILSPAIERRARVLVIDDDPMVARVVERAIGDLHHVEIANTPKEGLARIIASSYDVILCDLMMPDMTGMELHADIARRVPAAAARMVFMTGGAFTNEAEVFLERVPNLKLWKPFEAKELREVVLLALGQ